MDQVENLWGGPETKDGVIIERLRFAIRHWKKRNPNVPSARDEALEALHSSTVKFLEEDRHAGGDLSLPGRNAGHAG